MTDEVQPIAIMPPPHLSAWPSGVGPVSIKPIDSSWEGVRAWSVHTASGQIGRLEHDGMYWRGVRPNHTSTPRRRVRWQAVADLVDRYRAGTGASRYA